MFIVKHNIAIKFSYIYILNVSEVKYVLKQITNINIVYIAIYNEVI